MSSEGTPVDNPYAVLGIAPMLDADAIKRAYFKRLATTPPHGDPEAFRKLRAAYETLAQADTRALAWLHAPVDRDAEIAAWETQFRARVDAACASLRSESEKARVLDRFVRQLARMRLTPT